MEGYICGPVHKYLWWQVSLCC